jgi:crossover junction endonuclease MUS81
MKIKNIESTQLMIGDFFWIIEIINKHTLESEWYPLDYIIERKQGDDLASSIVDKRYKDQIFRLK